MIRFSFFFLLFLIFNIIACKEDAVQDELIPLFEQINTGSLSDTEIKEASGIAPSYKYPGLYWLHNDSGDTSRLFLVDSSGSVKATVYLKNIINRDWEDLKTYKNSSDGRSYVYVADIGDNFNKYEHKMIYRFEEPFIPSGTSNPEVVIEQVDKVIIKYYDGKRDAETLLLDPISAQIFIISKWEKNVSIYEVPVNFNWNDTVTLTNQGTLRVSAVVSGDISENGEEILLKTYLKIYYWKRKKVESLFETLARSPSEIPYEPEGQGEALCWALGGKDFYTVSECLNSIACDIRLYRRKDNLTPR